LFLDDFLVFVETCVGGLQGKPKDLLSHEIEAPELFALSTLDVFGQTYPARKYLNMFFRKYPTRNLVQSLRWRIDEIITQNNINWENSDKLELAKSRLLKSPCAFFYQP
jgi:hypothetical protein